VLWWGLMYKTYSGSETQTLLRRCESGSGHTEIDTLPMPDSGVFSGLADDVSSRDGVEESVEADPTWDDVKQFLDKNGVHVSNTGSNVFTLGIEDLLRKTHRMTTPLVFGSFEDDEVSRYYLGLRVIAAYEAVFFRNLDSDLAVFSYIKAKAELRKQKNKRGRSRRLVEWLFSSCGGSAGEADSEEYFISQIPVRYRLGLKRAFGVLLLDHDLTLSLIAFERLKNYAFHHVEDHARRRGICRVAKDNVAKARSTHPETDYLAESDFYALSRFSVSIPAEAGAIRLRGVVQNDWLCVPRALGNDPLDFSAMYADALEQLKESIDTDKDWPMLKIGLIDKIFRRLRDLAKAEARGANDEEEHAFDRYSSLREHAITTIFSLFNMAFIARYGEKEKEIADAIERLRQNNEKTKNQGKSMFSSRAIFNEERSTECSYREFLVVGAPLRYIDGLLPLSRLGISDPWELANLACAILKHPADIFATRFRADFKYDPARYAATYEKRPDQREEYDKFRKEQRRDEQLWSICFVFGAVISSVAPSRSQYKYVVAEAEKAARRAASDHAREESRYRRAVGIATFHAVLPFLGDIVHDLTKVKPRFTSDTIFQCAYWKNAVDITLRHVQTMQFEHRYTHAVINRTRIDQRKRMPGGEWSPSERIAGHNLLPPGTNRENVIFNHGRSDISEHTRYRNGLMSERPLSSRAILPEEPPYQPGPSGRYPTLTLSRPAPE